MECGMCLWKLQDNLLEWVLSFYHGGSQKDQTQILSFAADTLTLEVIFQVPVY